MQEMQGVLDVDSLGYLSLAGLRTCVEDPQNYCTACFDGNYPEPVPYDATARKFMLETASAVLLSLLLALATWVLVLWVGH